MKAAERTYDDVVAKLISYNANLDEQNKVCILYCGKSSLILSFVFSMG
jgi:hypothetical protein